MQEIWKTEPGINADCELIPEIGKCFKLFCTVLLMIQQATKWLHRSIATAFVQ